MTAPVSSAVAAWAASIADTDPTPAEVAAGQRIAANLTPDGAG